MRGLRWLLVGALFVAAMSCDNDAKPRPEQPPEAAPTARTFPVGGKLLFIYADVLGRFQNASTAEQVPKPSRKVVRVIDTTARKRSRRDHKYVHVVDLTEAPTNDTYIGHPVTRQSFEQRAIASLPAGEGSPFKVGPPTNHGKALVPHDQVIVYGTSWCGACAAARRWLRGRNEVFVEKDVEKDTAARAELAAKAAAAGISPNRVPIIDVRGRLVVGFDKARLTALLKKKT